MSRLVDVDVTPQQHDYLVALVNTGLYGATVREVALSLILAGIRGAVERDFIKTTKSRSA